MSEFTEYLQELFRDIGVVHARRMFGGHGLFHDGLMFGLVVDDTLYLKADDETAEEFKARGLTRFEYQKGGKSVKISYYLAPEEILEDPQEAAVWAKRALEVALKQKYTAR